MNIEKLSVNRLNEILKSTVDSIKSSQNEIIDIVNYSREECKKLEEVQKNLQLEIIEAID